MSQAGQSVTRALESAIWVEAHVQAARSALVHGIGGAAPRSKLRGDLNAAMAECNLALKRVRKTIERERRR